MSASAMDYDTNNGDRYDGTYFSHFLLTSCLIHRLFGIDDRYDRDPRSASPRHPESGRESTRRRSASPNGNGAPDRYVYVSFIASFYSKSKSMTKHSRELLC